MRVQINKCDFTMMVSTKELLIKPTLLVACHRISRIHFVSSIRKISQQVYYYD